ncbi:hypothetical protein ABT187_50080, partial [Streptomyces sp. NPDC001817]|uniref:hypothetical protein n=1 Tax=Streptomyces sp. NPDC001817 TaxID=3154398 RepID=UPI0033165E65
TNPYDHTQYTPARTYTPDGYFTTRDTYQLHNRHQAFNTNPIEYTDPTGNYPTFPAKRMTGFSGIERNTNTRMTALAAYRKLSMTTGNAHVGSVRKRVQIIDTVEGKQGPWTPAHPNELRPRDLLKKKPKMRRKVGKVDHSSLELDLLVEGKPYYAKYYSTSGHNELFRTRLIAPPKTQHQNGVMGRFSAWDSEQNNLDAALKDLALHVAEIRGFNKPKGIQDILNGGRFATKILFNADVEGDLKFRGSRAMCQGCAEVARRASVRLRSRVTVRVKWYGAAQMTPDAGLRGVDGTIMYGHADAKSILNDDGVPQHGFSFNNGRFSPDYYHQW